MSLIGSPSSTGSAARGGAVGRGAGGAVGVKARFFSGGSPRFLVDNRRFSDMPDDDDESVLTKGEIDCKSALV